MHIEKTVKSRIQIAQFLARARVQKIGRTVLQRGVNARLAHERAATLRERGVPHLLHAMQRGELALKLPLQGVLHLGGDPALREIQPRRGDPRDHHHHRRQQSAAKAHGKSTRRVAPFFSSTGRSSVVLLLTHALSMY